MSRPARQTTVTYALISAAFMAAGAAMAAWSLYPVYESRAFVAVSAASIAAGAVIVVVSDRLGWNGLSVAGLTVAAYVGIGLTLAIPSFTAGDTTLLAALGELARGPVAGWKDVVTLPLPLGEYGATLVPPLALLLVGTVVSTTFAARARRWWGFAGLVTAIMVATAVLIGPATRAPELAWAPYGVYMNQEFVIGLSTFAVLLGWTTWRAIYVRRRSLLKGSSTASLSGRHPARSLGAFVGGLAMVTVALVVGSLVAGPITADIPRSVARSVIEPRVVVNSTVTPLASYRNYFSDDQFDAELFTVDVTSGEADRVRLATLPFFDGDSFTAAGPEGTSAPFQRVPSGIAAPENSVPVSATITLKASTGVWVPLIGRLGSVTFHGEHNGELVDSFFYQPATGTGLVTNAGALVARDSYTVSAYVPATAPALNMLGAAPGGDTISSSLVPTSLVDWVTHQGVTHDGAGFAELVKRLRERGYLSHSLTESGTTAAWEAALGSYSFAGSAAGSSYDRIDRLFTQLNEREASVADTPGASLVAAIGDDEQFAAAVALIAANLGFPSRVVLGVHLTDTDVTGWSVPACVEGTCRGQNMAVWAEVQSANGTWIPVDVTPQHTNSPSPIVTQQRDPKFAPDLDPRRAEPIAPPSSQRGSAAQTQPPAPADQSFWDAIGPVARAAGISLLAVLVILGPFLAILVWKGLRRRRRRVGQPWDSIHNGWEEYLDTAVDAGFAPMPLATRLETARAYGSLSGVRLAQLTDSTTFSTRGAVLEDADEFWRLVASERAAWLADRGFWGRAKMRLSLRSMWNSVATQAPEPVPSTAQPAHWHARASDKGGANGVG